MGTSRYLAAAGIRRNQAGSVLSNILEYPYIVIIGPSGNMAQIHGPSGFNGRLPGADDALAITRLQGYEQTFNHAALEWYKNEILYSVRVGNEVNERAIGYAWQPYGSETTKINTGVFEPEQNVDMEDYVMLDGANHKWALEQPAVAGNSLYAYQRIGGAVHWVIPRDDGESLVQGLYKGGDPFSKTDPNAQTGFEHRGGILGARANDTAVVFVAGAFGRSGGTTTAAGVEYSFSSSSSNNMCDMIYHKGTMYVAKQHSLIGIVPGAKGNYMMHDITVDESNISSQSDVSNYTARGSTNNFGGSLSRSLAEHNGELYMLSNNGKVHRVEAGGLVEIADLTVLGTPWSSGITGGALPQTDSGWSGSSAYRCKLVSFNNQLHAFLNFSTGFRIAKASTGSVGNGVFWATSFDAANWSDRSEMLPTSGIIPPSGQASSTWLTDITPYIFSGRNGGDAFPYPSGYINGSIGGPQPASEDNKPAQPSGFCQLGNLPFWSSGNMIDVAGTTFNNLQIPLELNTVSGHLFPTFVQYPQGFGFQSPSGGYNGGLSPAGDNIFAPSGVGPSGYDYTGVKNYHISAAVDEFDKKMLVTFSEDFDEGGTLLYELTRSSGWALKNQAYGAKQFNGLKPIDLYDPEVIIPSGDLLNPNPRIDTVNKTVTIDYTLHDWIFWDQVDVIGEYSLDDQTWSQFCRTTNKSTGTKQSDPSGVIGTSHQIVWNYTQDLSKTAFYPNVRIRLRAEKP